MSSAEFENRAPSGHVPVNFQLVYRKVIMQAMSLEKLSELQLANPKTIAWLASDTLLLEHLKLYNAITKVSKPPVDQVVIDLIAAGWRRTEHQK